MTEKTRQLKMRSVIDVGHILGIPYFGSSPYSGHILQLQNCEATKFSDNGFVQGPSGFEVCDPYKPAKFRVRICDGDYRRLTSTMITGTYDPQTNAWSIDEDSKTF